MNINIDWFIKQGICLLSGHDWEYQETQYNTEYILCIPWLSYSVRYNKRTCDKCGKIQYVRKVKDNDNWEVISENSCPVIFK